MIKNKLIEIAGVHEAREQFHQQFPKNWKEIEKKKWKHIFTQLDLVTQAIKDAKPDDIESSGYPAYHLTVRKDSEASLALIKFRAMLDETLTQIVLTGRHFNPLLLLRAYQKFNDHSRSFGNDRYDPRAMLFWRQVIGYIQRFLPVNYVQAYREGLYHAAENVRRGENQGRSFTFNYLILDRGTYKQLDFYPTLDSRFGFDFSIQGHFERGGRWMIDSFQNLYLTKEKSIADLGNTQLQTSIAYTC